DIGRKRELHVSGCWKHRLNRRDILVVQRHEERVDFGDAEFRVQDVPGSRSAFGSIETGSVPAGKDWVEVVVTLSLLFEPEHPADIRQTARMAASNTEKSLIAFLLYVRCGKVSIGTQCVRPLSPFVTNRRPEPGWVTMRRFRHAGAVGSLSGGGPGGALPAAHLAAGVP